MQSNSWLQLRSCSCLETARSVQSAAVSTTPYSLTPSHLTHLHASPGPYRCLSLGPSCAISLDLPLFTQLYQMQPCQIRPKSPLLLSRRLPIEQSLRFFLPPQNSDKHWSDNPLTTYPKWPGKFITFQLPLFSPDRKLPHGCNFVLCTCLYFSRCLAWHRILIKKALTIPVTDK